MLARQVVIDQIEITKSGVIQIRMEKQIVDADQVVTSEYHRTAIGVGNDVNAQMDAVNKHLAQMGWPAVPADDIARVADHAIAAWTPDRIASVKNTLDTEIAAKRSELAQIESMATEAVLAADAQLAAAKEELARITNLAAQSTITAAQQTAPS